LIGDDELARMGRQTALYCELARDHAAIVNQPQTGRKIRLAAHLW
jgi:hypothetical protein